MFKHESGNNVARYLFVVVGGLLDTKAKVLALLASSGAYS